MDHDSFDVYRAVMEDTNQLSNRRTTLDNIYVTIVTLVLAADGYLIGNSHLDSWFPVFETIAVSLVGIAFTRHWQRVLRDLKEILNFRYAWLKALEADAKLSGIGATVYTAEDKEIYAPRQSHKTQRKFGFGARSQQLQMIFICIFALIPILYALIHLLAAIPQLHTFIQPT